MKTDNRYSPENNRTPLRDSSGAPLQHPGIYNVRTCPYCNGVIFGMPGGYDAICGICGYKDPSCCSD